MPRRLRFESRDGKNADDISNRTTHSPTATYQPIHAFEHTTPLKENLMPWTSALKKVGISANWNQIQQKENVLISVKKQKIKC